MPKKSFYILLYSICSMWLYFVMAYRIQRTDTLLLSGGWTLLFILFTFILLQKWSLTETKWLIAAAFAMRFIILFSTPSLSDDVYRFIWDGRLSAAGIDPYLHLPSEYARSESGYSIGLSQDLFSKLNSPAYFTVYPPILQGIFLLAAKTFPIQILGNIVVLRSVIILAEVGTTYILLKLLGKLKLPSTNVLIYLLNPLIIIELTGNLHFEALMICLVLLSIYFLVYEKPMLSAIALGSAVGVKLLPLIFIPILFRKLNLKQFLLFCATLSITIVALFLPFFSWKMIDHIMQSVGLYFQHFEFNAGVFYIIRWIGFETVGYDVIAFSGKAISILSIAAITTYSMLRKKNVGKTMFTEMQLIVLIYLLLALVVHPWYISGLLVYSVFTKAYYPLVWAFMAGFTYVAYSQIPYKESMTVVIIEYSLVAGCFLYEYFRIRRIDSTLNEDTACLS